MLHWLAFVNPIKSLETLARAAEAWVLTSDTKGQNGVAISNDFYNSSKAQHHHNYKRSCRFYAEPTKPLCWFEWLFCKCGWPVHCKHCKVEQIFYRVNPGWSTNHLMMILMNDVLRNGFLFWSVLHGSSRDHLDSLSRRFWLKHWRDSVIATCTYT